MPASGRAAADLEAAARAIERFLRALGLDPESDPQLAETGRLVAEAFDRDLLDGYAMDPAQILSERVAADPGGGLVVMRNVATTIVCPHHLLPASGVVHLGYLPTDAIVGLGALGRLVDCYAHRLVLQESFVQSVASALCEHLGAAGAACVAELSPACVCARGERRAGATVLSVGSAGVMQTDGPRRAELMTLLKGSER